MPARLEVVSRNQNLPLSEIPPEMPLETLKTLISATSEGELIASELLALSKIRKALSVQREKVLKALDDLQVVDRSYQQEESILVKRLAELKRVGPSRRKLA